MEDSLLTPWDYFNKYKNKKWKDLTKEQQSRLILAIQIIYDDIGVVAKSELELTSYLKNNLPLEYII